MHFEERCRIDGAASTAAALLPHFEAVEAARGDISADLLRVHDAGDRAPARAGEPLDLVILEVGLGGRLDAVNAFDADCAVITSIDIDHAEYLGPDRETIGREKAGIMRAGRPAIVSDPVPPQSVDRHARARSAPTCWLLGRDFSYSRRQAAVALGGPPAALQRRLAYPALRGANQLLNAAGVLAAFEALRERLPISAQAVRNGLALVELPGRFQIVPGQPTLVLDVAPQPARGRRRWRRTSTRWASIPRTHAVFGAMARQGHRGASCARMAPLVDHWHFTDLPMRARRDGRGSWRALSGAVPAWPRPGDAHTPCRPARRRSPRRSAQPTPLIESWSSAPSTPWVAC